MPQTNKAPEIITGESAAPKGVFPVIIPGGRMTMEEDICGISNHY